MFFIEIDCQVKYNTIILCSCALGVKFYYTGSNLIKRNFSADKPLKKLLTDITEVQCADGASDNFPSLSVGIAQSAENENSDFTPFS